ncbi:hypothetical protein B0H63DRAFT_125296 [Podospora didyma]|uniref:Secreted protein n=1 Tax=Podospora didyma TaxID=330526 RepID=A0AAE0P0A6_9PEZI|nr:hypothetical protein B0H63DRAFT_125296 [Podospora didyma]
MACCRFIFAVALSRSVLIGLQDCNWSHAPYCILGRRRRRGLPSCPADQNSRFEHLSVLSCPLCPRFGIIEGANLRRAHSTISPQTSLHPCLRPGSEVRGSVDLAAIRSEATCQSQRGIHVLSPHKRLAPGHIEA